MKHDICMKDFIETKLYLDFLGVKDFESLLNIQGLLILFEKTDLIYRD